MRTLPAPGAAALAMATLVAAAITQGCSPDPSSMQRVAQSRLGAPAATGSTATLPDDPGASKGHENAPGSQPQAPDSSTPASTEVGIPVYPGARRIYTGSEVPTVSGIETISLTTTDQPDAVLKFYARIYPKPQTKHPLPGSPRWITSNDVNGASTRITIPDPSAEGAMHVIEVAHLSTETLITLMHVDATPTATGTGTPAASASPASGSLPGASSGMSSGLGSPPASSAGGLSSPSTPGGSTLPGLGHSSPGGLTPPGGLSAPRTPGGLLSPSSSGSMSGSGSAAGPASGGGRPHL